MEKVPYSPADNPTVFRDVVDALPIPIVVIHNDDTPLLYNRAFTNLFGYTMEDLPTREAWMQALYPDPAYRAVVEEHWDRSVAAGSTAPGIATVCCKDKTCRDVTFRIALTPEKHAIIIGEDVTATMPLKQQLENTRQRYDDLVESLFTCLAHYKVVYNYNGEPVDFIFERINEAYRRHMGFGDEIIGRPLSEVFHAIYSDSFDWHGVYSSVAVTRKPARFETYSHALKKWFSVALNSPQQGQLVALFEDTTQVHKARNDKQELLQRLRHQQNLESIGDLAAGIAHEFNNILTAVFGNISMARMQAATGVDIVPWLKQAESAADRARALTGQLLTFARGGAPVKKRRSIGPMLIDGVSFLARDSSVVCTTDISDDLWPVHIDESQIGQVLHHLVGNALEAMPTGGTLLVQGKNIRISAGDGKPLAPGKYIKISFIDSGHGIPASIRNRVFDPFFTTRDNLNGLGLTISHSIVSKHGGYLTFTDPPQGAECVMYLPSAEESGADEPAAMPSWSASTGNILVLDDEHSIRRILSHMLAHLGYSAVEAREGHEAVSLYRQAYNANMPFDAVLMDIHIPDGSGAAWTIEQLLEVDPHVRALVFSGSPQDDLMQTYAEHGFLGFVHKPFNLTELADTLKRILSLPSASASERRRG